METLLQPVQQSKRILVLDILRRFSLLGILMVNMPVFNSPFVVLLGEGRLWTDPVNVRSQWIVDFSFHGKFYVLFSFLFCKICQCWADGPDKLPRAEHYIVPHCSIAMALAFMAG